MMTYLYITLISLLVSILPALFLIKDLEKKTLIALYLMVFAFLISFTMWIIFDRNTPHWQFILYLPWFETLNLTFSFAIDGISIFFVILTLFISCLCILATWNIFYKRQELLACIVLITTCLIGVFTSLDLLWFFVFFEAVLPPMLFLIGIWGSRRRKIKANYYFVLYTLFGSIFMLFGILALYWDVGTTNLLFLNLNCVCFEKQLFLWFCFFIGFAVKIPMIPLHIWLPEAHVEAPTIGSVILASLLLKMGGYGFIRVLVSLMPHATYYFLPLINTLAIVSVVYASIIALIQIDLKRIVAYSSIAHMNFAVLGIFSLTVQGIQGSIILMLAHGFVSGGLFFIVGMLYDRYHTKIIKYYGGLARVMPVFSSFFLFFSFSNIGFPGSGNFVGEVLTFVGIFEVNIFASIICLLSTIITTGYSIWLFNRVSFGNLKTTYIKYFSDLSTLELNILTPLVVATLLLGIYPTPILDTTYASVCAILSNL